MKMTHRQSETRARRAQDAFTEREFAESERELRELFAPLSARQASPELTARLRGELRRSQAQMRREAMGGWLRRWMTRRVAVPLPVLAALLALLLGLAAWIAYLELAPPPPVARASAGQPAHVQEFAVAAGRASTVWAGCSTHSA